MHRIMIIVFGLMASFLTAPLAHAATIYTPGDPNFQVTGDPFTGTVSATIGHTGIATGDFTDLFQFTLGQTGLGSGTVATSTSIFASVTDLDISSLTFNGVSGTKLASPQDLVETYYFLGVPVTAGALNEIAVTGVSRGNGSYGGNLTFIPFSSAAPEPASWAMMIVGFGVIGLTLRYRRRSTRIALAA